jgi:hypothetical protein
MLSFIDTSVDVAYTGAQVFGFFIPPPLYGKVFGHGRKRGKKERSARRVDDESKKAGRRAALHDGTYGAVCGHGDSSD